MIVAVPNDVTFMKYAVNGILNMPPHHVTRWDKEVFEYIAKKYDLKILDIVYEKVQSYHKEWYISILFRNLIFGKEKLIENSILKRVIVKIINMLSKPLRKNFHDEFLPNGMTMVVIFQKD